MLDRSVRRNGVIRIDHHIDNLLNARDEQVRKSTGSNPLDRRRHWISSLGGADEVGTNRTNIKLNRDGYQRSKTKFLRRGGANLESGGVKDHLLTNTPPKVRQCRLVVYS